MRLRLFLSLLLLSLPLPVAAKALAQCMVEAQPERSLIRLIYDPFENVQESQTLELTVFTPDVDGEPCQLGLAIGGAGSSRERVLRHRGDELRYEIELEGSTTANDLNAPTRVNPKRAGGTLSQSVKLVVPAGQFARAGSYTDHITLRLHDLSDGVPRKMGADMILAITVDIPARAQINLAGSTSPVFGGINASGLDFGELQTGKERDAFVQVRATSPVILTLQSANRGVLSHKTEPTNSRAIPYALTIDGEAISLTGSSARINRTPVNGLGADNYRMVARIVDADGRKAGRYEDVITISVEPK